MARIAPVKSGRPPAASMIGNLLAVIRVASDGKRTFTTRDLEREAGLSYSSAYVWLKALAAAGWVEGHLDRSVYHQGQWRWRLLKRVVPVKWRSA